jgi:hypothetical protein
MATQTKRTIDPELVDLRGGIFDTLPPPFVAPLEVSLPPPPPMPLPSSAPRPVPPPRYAGPPRPLPPPRPSLRSRAPR